MSPNTAVIVTICMAVITLLVNITWLLFAYKVKNEVLERLDAFAEQVEKKYSRKESCEKDFNHLADRLTRARI